MSFIISNIVNESFVGCRNVGKQSGYVPYEEQNASIFRVADFIDIVSVFGLVE